MGFKNISLVIVKERIAWVKCFLDNIRYRDIKSKKEKGLVIEILQNSTNSSKRNIFRWLSKYKRVKLKSKTYKRHERVILFV